MYDIIIIGGGPAGYRAAEIAGNRGKRILLVEKRAVGGTCLHEGCIPMKAYLHICDIKEKAKQLITQNLLSSSVPKVNLDTLSQHSHRTIATLEKGILAGLKGAGVEIVQGSAKIASASTEYVTIDVGDKCFAGKNLIIATGGQTVRIYGAKVAQAYRVIDGSDIFTMKDVPKNIFIIGSGAIGLESASVFNSLGVDVTVVESMPQICGEMDKEMSQVLQKSMEKRGIHFLLNTKLDGCGQNEVSLCSEDKTFSAKPECVLIAIGRKPFTEGLGLENIDIDYDKTGISIDEKCRTSCPLIYACGDVTGKMMLAHTAYRQVRVAVDNICGVENTMEYDTIPRIVYSLPSYIGVGYTEEYCQNHGLPYLAKVLPMTYNGKYYAENGMDGSRAKLIVNSDTHRILGFHVVGLDMPELALTAESMIINNMTIEDVCNIVFPHPTFGEIIQTLADSIE